METCRQRGTPEPPARRPWGTDGHPSPSPGTCLQGRPRWHAGHSVGTLSGADPGTRPSGHVSNASASHVLGGASAVTGGTQDAARCFLHFGAVTPQEAACTTPLFLRLETGGVTASQVTKRRKQKTGRTWLLAAPIPPPEQIRPCSTGSGRRRQGGRGPRLCWSQAELGCRGWKPGRAGVRGPEARRSWGAAVVPRKRSHFSGQGRVRPGLLGCCRGTSPGPRQLLHWREPQLRGWSATPGPDPAALRGASCRHLSQQTRHCVLRVRSPLTVPKSPLPLPTP